MSRPARLSIVGVVLVFLCNLIPGDLQQAAVVEAIFVYNTAMRDQMMPRKPLPRPELYEQVRKPLPNTMPGAQPEVKPGENKTDKK